MQRGGALLSEGGYGCVFHPEITCKGKTTTDTGYVSKIQRNDFNARNEIEVGEIVADALTKSSSARSGASDRGERYFAPVISSCPIDVRNLDATDKDKCRMLKLKDVKEYLLLKIRYIDAEEFDVFLSQQQNSPLIFMTFISSFNHLLRSLEILHKAKVVHNDLKGGNIMYDKSNSLPIIIDFGLSIPIEKLSNDSLHNYFYMYVPDYYVWAPEIHLINYLLHVNAEPKADELKEVASACTKANAYLRGMSPAFKAQYEKACYKELLTYQGLSSNDALMRALMHWPTWDNYSLSGEFLRLLYYLTRNPGSGVLDNEFVIFATQLLLMNINPDPAKRMGPSMSLKAFNRFLYNQKIDRTSVFDEIIRNIAENKEGISASIRTANKEMRLLSKKTRRVL